MGWLRRKDTNLTHFQRDAGKQRQCQHAARTLYKCLSFSPFLLSRVEFVKLAATYATVNLGQGFPDFPPPDFLKEAFVRALSGENHMLHQYTRAFVRGQTPLLSNTSRIPC